MTDFCYIWLVYWSTIKLKKKNNRKPNTLKVVIVIFAITIIPWKKYWFQKRKNFSTHFKTLQHINICLQHYFVDCLISMLTKTKFLTHVSHFWIDSCKCSCILSNRTILKFISDIFLLFCFLSSWKSFFEARKNVLFSLKSSFCFWDIQIVEY